MEDIHGTILKSTTLFESGGAFFVYFLFFSIYFFPTWISRQKKYANGIFVLNLFLGWTFLGWIGALIWAVSSPETVE